MRSTTPRVVPAVLPIDELPTYESQLDASTEWAMEEGSRHFEERSKVHAALRRIAGRLEQLRIPYAVVGGMALFHHGVRRFTEDVDVLVTADGLREVHERLSGLGWVPPFEGSKHLRDVQNKVKVEFIVTGQYPGDGQPKPVAFPDPADVAVEIDGIRFLGLPSLVELKLASGMTTSRLKDLGDVQELITQLDLPRAFDEQLDPYVRTKFVELWDGIRNSPTQDELGDTPPTIEPEEPTR